jgi:putative flavoprotein involved in K+ transport
MHLPAVVIGAGHAGLAMSRRLTERSIDHVVIERGEVANSWRTERWDSLRLLTPNWHARLPGANDQDGPLGRDPDGYMTAPDFAALVDRYAATVRAPVVDQTMVTRLAPDGGGYRVVTDRGVWRSATVVIATGGCALANVPPLAEALPPSVTSITPLTYYNPQRLPDGGVLVVGASATGVQLAEEIQASGRPVTLAVGEHVRLPRTHRGRDIFWWTETAGILAERYDEVDDLVRARHLPSPQLVGSPERRPVDLNRLQSAGVRIVGRLGRIRDGTAQFSGGMANVCALADLKLERLLRRLDETATAMGFDDEIGPPERVEPTRTSRSQIGRIHLAAEGIRTVVWATGYRPDHRWVDLPVFDRKGRIRHDGGIVEDAPGLYVLGLNLLRRRRSSYIAGAAGDTEELANHLRRHLDLTTTTRAPVNSGVVGS